MLHPSTFVVLFVCLLPVVAAVGGPASAGAVVVGAAVVGGTAAVAALG